MGTLIDSSIGVAAERRKIDFDAVLAQHADEPVAFAGITASELLHGVRPVTASPRTTGGVFPPFPA